MRRFPAASFVAAALTLFCLSLLSGCGGGSTNSTTTVASIVLTPATFSLNQGQVAVMSAVGENSAGSVVAADITFTSANTAIATVSPGGLICGGTWDQNFITCSVNPVSTGVGTTTITAASGSVTATATVSVHEHVDLVRLNAPPNCISLGLTVGVTASVYNTTAQGCSNTAPCDITSTAGTVTYGTNDATIAGISTDGVVSAFKPGGTFLFASVSGVNSVATPFTVCPVTSIVVHSAADNTTSFTLAPSGTQAVKADVLDSAGATISPSLIWGSSKEGAATAAVASTGSPNGTITAIHAGTTSVTATCSNPDCNANLPAQYSSNVITAMVTGNTSTTVYAASTSSTSLIPISTDANAAGTAITLPFAPNSILSDSAGINLYLGSASGLMIVTTATGAVTSNTIAGTVMAVSSDGAYVVIANSANGQIYVFATSGSTVNFQHGATTPSVSFTPDSKTDWIVNQNTAYADSVGFPSTQFTLPYSPNAVTFSAQGGLGYFTANGLVDVRSTCNRGEVQTLSANNPTLIAPGPGGGGVVAADSPNLDIVTTSNVMPGCPTIAANSIASYDLGVGAFNAKQLFLSSDGSRAWIISDLPQLISFNLATSTPVAIPYTGGVTGLSGGVRLDGEQLYIGTSDGTVHRIDVASNTDAAQITVGLKDTSGNATNPNLVYVLPH